MGSQATRRPNDRRRPWKADGRDRQGRRRGGIPRGKVSGLDEVVLEPRKESLVSSRERNEVGRVSSPRHLQGVGALGEKQIHDAFGSVIGRHMKRRPSVLVLGVDIGSLPKKSTRCRKRLVGQACGMERGLSFCIGCLHVVVRHCLGARFVTSSDESAACESAACETGASGGVSVSADQRQVQEAVCWLFCRWVVSSHPDLPHAEGLLV